MFLTLYYTIKQFNIDKIIQTGYWTFCLIVSLWYYCINNISFSTMKEFIKNICISYFKLNESRNHLRRRRIRTLMKGLRIGNSNCVYVLYVCNKVNGYY